MPHLDRLADEAVIASPALIFYPRFIRANTARIIEMAGSPSRLRPHVKTHKTVEITKIQLECGIVKFKCATIAEAEALAVAGAKDILLAYPVIGPTAARLAALSRKYADIAISALVDSAESLEGLRSAALNAGQTFGAYLDLDVGQHRTGVLIGPRAEELAEGVARTRNLVFKGLHAYDGHNHQDSQTEREAAVHRGISSVIAFRDRLHAAGIDCRTIIAGGTPTFPIYAAMQRVPDLECSPGTYVLHDHGYGSRFPDLTGIVPAAALLTRVVSKPTGNLVTFDLGTKAVASDPPMTKRVHFPDIADYNIIAHNEEHLVIESPHADSIGIGAAYYALPWHICPTVALHDYALIADDENRIVDQWSIVARNRTITV